MSIEQMQEFYRNVHRIIVVLDKIVSNLKHWNVDKAMRQYRNMIQKMVNVIGFCNQYGSELSEQGIELSYDAVMEQLRAVMNAQEKKDEILLADMLQLGLRPVLLQWLAIIGTVYTPENENCFQRNLDALKGVAPELAEQLWLYAGTSGGFANFVLEPTESGRSTIRYTEGEQDFYLYGNGDPFIDLFDYLRGQIAYGQEEYHLLGCASPYMIFAIRNLCGDAAIIHYYESRQDSLCIMLQQSDLASCIMDGTLVLHYDPKLQDLVREMSVPGHQVILYPPAIRLIQEEQVRQAVERFYTATHSMQEQQYLLFSNYVQNRRRITHNVDELKSSFSGRKVYIVAAGPSLDKNLHLLAGREKNSILIATGTVFGKMMHMGIRPDYVIVSEANARVRYQFRELWQEQIPLLLISTATWVLANQYEGPTYMIFQEGFEPAEQAAMQEGRRLYQSGGSVSTLALDVSIRLQASTVIFIGLDLAFTGQKAHAEDTSQTIAPEERDLIPVPSYDGGIVYADTKFQLYANWIARRLNKEDMSDVTNVRIINATEGGAYVNGMEYMTLEEALKV